MNKKEFFAALRRALAPLPEQERDNVLQYYEDYFLDAEGESEESVIRGLGDPQKIAEDILRDYRELQPRAADQPPQRRWKGVSPWLLLLLIPLCLLIGVPVFGGILAAGGGLLAALCALLLAAALVIFFLPAALVLCGLALCVFACFVWSVPASAVLTLGLGLVLLALGGLVALLFIKMLRVFVPPVFRCIVGFFGWICRKVRGLFK